LCADHVRMATTTTNATLSAPGELRRLILVPASGRRPLNRDDALRQVRTAKRHVQSRDERFAHLKRVYD
jgi:hypothetical protein